MSNPDPDVDFRTPEAFAEAEQARQHDDVVTRRDPGPTDDAAAQAEAEGLATTPEEQQAYREHLERGAHQQGEGAPSF